MLVIILPLITDILAYAISGFAKRRMKQNVLQTICLSALILYLAALLYITVFSRQRVLEVRWNLIPLQDFDAGMFIGQLSPNILLFIPVGILLDGLLPKSKLLSLILIGVGISLYIELVQLLVHAGIFDVDDLLSNSLGVILGVFPARLLMRGFTP